MYRNYLSVGNVSVEDRCLLYFLATRFAFLLISCITYLLLAYFVGNIEFYQVAQIRMKSEGIPFHVVDLAVGGELELPINYYDILGNTLRLLRAYIMFLMYLFFFKYLCCFVLKRDRFSRSTWCDYIQC